MSPRVRIAWMSAMAFGFGWQGAGTGSGVGGFAARASGGAAMPDTARRIHKREFLEMFDSMGAPFWLERLPASHIQLYRDPQGTVRQKLKIRSRPRSFR